LTQEYPKLNSKEKGRPPYDISVQWSILVLLTHCIKTHMELKNLKSNLRLCH